MNVKCSITETGQRLIGSPRAQRIVTEIHLTRFGQYKVKFHHVINAMFKFS